MNINNIIRIADDKVSLSAICLSDPYPPPNNVYLMEANFNQLLFQWSSVTPCCKSLRYLINASNCGHCPNVTNDTTVTCTGFSLGSLMCLFSVQTRVCDNITGNESRSVKVNLRGMSQLSYKNNKW